MARTDELVRRTLRLLPDVNQQVHYYARKHDISANDYIMQAVSEKLARENRDYDLPAMEIQRLNQMIAAVAGLEAVNKQLIRKVDAIHAIMDNLALDDMEALEKMDAQRQAEAGSENRFDDKPEKTTAEFETDGNDTASFDDGFETVNKFNMDDMEDLL